MSSAPSSGGTTITNENLIQEEIKRRLNSGNACITIKNTRPRKKFQKQ
jgi:hypothetical protein